MERWHLTMGLAAAAIAAAVVTPGWEAFSGPANPPLPASEPLATIAPSELAASPGPLSLIGHLDQSTVLLGSDDDRFLVLEVSAPPEPSAERQPVHLSVVMDTSGSMGARGKLSSARSAAQDLVSLLGPSDTFSLITFDDRAEVRIPSGPVVDPYNLRRRIEQVRTGGGTNLHDGLAAGLSEVQSVTGAGVRRVVLLSDGIANVGVTDALTLRQQAGSRTHEAVTVSTIGLGLDYNEDLLAAMADSGGGTYRFVDQPGSLTEMFREELQQASTVVARRTTLELDVPEGVQIREVYGYDTVRTAGQQSVFLGDIYAGQTRKIVARLRVSATQAGPVPVLRARLTHVSSESQRTHQLQTEVAAMVTRDARAAEASVNAEARKQATKAQVGTLVAAAARDFADGDVRANQEGYRKAIELVDQFNGDFEDAEMLRSLDTIASQQEFFAQSPPSSEAGRAQVKRAKEGARAYAH